MKDKLKIRNIMMKYKLIMIVLLSFIIVGCGTNGAVKVNLMKNDFVNENPLHDAVRARDINMVRFLIEQSITLDVKNIHGYTPLHLAVRLQEYEIAKLLIENGALINTEDHYKDTPLLDATRDNYVKISKLLICNGANRNVVDEYNMSPLSYTTKNKELILSRMLRADVLVEYCKEDTVEIKIPNAVVFVGLYDALMKEFQNDFEVWDAELTKKDLIFRFNNPIAIFEVNESDLQDEFEVILNDFFPRYVKIIEQYKQKIKEIRIEGHSSSEYVGAKTQASKDILNERLSKKRAIKVRDYAILNTLHETNINTQWVDNTFKAYGMSSKNLILNPDGSENKEASRRVEFRISQLKVKK